MSAQNSRFVTSLSISLSSSASVISILESEVLLANSLRCLASSAFRLRVLGLQAAEPVKPMVVVPLSNSELAGAPSVVRTRGQQPGSASQIAQQFDQEMLVCVLGVGFSCMCEQG